MLNAEDDSIMSLEDNEQIAFIPTGGSQLKFYIEKKYLDGLLQAQVHVYDSDIQSYVDAVAALNAEGNDGKIGYNTSKLELENFLHHEAVNECYDELNINITLAEIEDTEDVPEKVAKAVHSATSETEWNSINPDPTKTAEKQKKKVSKAKKLLNTKAIEKMSIERLRERNGYEEIKTWLDKINELCN